MPVGCELVLARTSHYQWRLSGCQRSRAACSAESDRTPCRRAGGRWALRVPSCQYRARLYAAGGAVSAYPAQAGPWAPRWPAVAARKGPVQSPVTRLIAEHRLLITGAYGAPSAAGSPRAGAVDPPPARPKSPDDEMAC